MDAGRAGRRCARGHEHRQAAAPGGVQCGALMLGADVDMNGGHRRLAADRGVAQRGVETGIFVRHGDQPAAPGRPVPAPWRSPPGRSRARCRSRRKMIDAAMAQRRDDRLTRVAHLHLDLMSHPGLSFSSDRSPWRRRRACPSQGEVRDARAPCRRCGFSAFSRLVARVIVAGAERGRRPMGNRGQPCVRRVRCACS